MAKLIYSAMSSLDGCVADNNGNLGWAEPDEAIHTHHLVHPASV